uniref:Uncharacterized protein n=1 Tax=Onchocerca volvulus TaxID=6282 RepID=A0A8R1XSN0_ONCVO
MSCWNKTAQFFDKTLMSILLRYVTTQNSIGRMVEHMERYYVGRDAGVLRREIINKTMIALVSASFKTIEAKKQPPLLACPQGCERISKFWLSCSFLSLLFSGLLTAIIAINKLEQDRKDRNLALVEKTVEIAKDKRN